ncbi:MAG TPA: FxLYD domain-containing protein [Flavobacteriaceae bacterium]|nr:FxLYD domain-containing protein [Flavobacteriaceae bacterium]
MERRDGKLSFIEKGIFFSGIVILIGLFGYLFYQIVNGEKTHADLKFSIERQEESPLTFKVEVTNTGGQTAEEVSMAFVLYENGKEIATTSASVTYMPVRSKTKLWIVFYDIQSADLLKVSSVSFREP